MFKINTVVRRAISLFLKITLETKNIAMNDKIPNIIEKMNMDVIPFKSSNAAVSPTIIE